MTSQNPWQECIDLCLTCRAECQSILFNHCLQKGGKYADANHVRIMNECIDMCQAASDAIARRSVSYAVICAACATVCEACAESCEQFETALFQQLAARCRAAAKSCRALSLGESAQKESLTLPPEDLPLSAQISDASSGNNVAA